MGEGEAASSLKSCATQCHALARRQELTAEEAKVLLRGLTHPDPQVWGPAYTWVEPLVSRLERLREILQDLGQHHDPDVKLRLLHWGVWPDRHLSDFLELGDGLTHLLRATSAKLRFEAVLLAHKAMNGCWCSKDAALLRIAMDAEPCPVVRTLMRETLGHGRPPQCTTSFQGAKSGSAITDSPKAAHLVRFYLDGLPGGCMAGAWASFQVQYDSLLRENLNRVSEYTVSYDRLPGKGRYSAWCRWRDALWGLLKAAQPVGGTGEFVFDYHSLRILDGDRCRIQSGEYHEVHCPQCGKNYATEDMLHLDWQDGRGPLGLAGGFKLFCPAQHLLYTAKTWTS